MSTLPRGVQQVSYKDSSYYRVRISRKNFKADKYFKELEEATEFLALSKAKKGKELIYSITEEERKSKPSYGDFSLGYFVDKYIEDYLSSDCKTELEKRNRTNKLSFLKTVKNASVLDRTLTGSEKDDLNIDTDSKVYTFTGLQVFWRL